MSNLINKSLSGFVNFPFSASILFNLELKEKFLRLLVGIFLLKESIFRTISLRFSYFAYEIETLILNSLIKRTFVVQNEMTGINLKINWLLKLASIFYSDKKSIDKIAVVTGSQGASLNLVYTPLVLSARLSYYLTSAFKDVENFDSFFDLNELKIIEKRAVIQKFFELKEVANSTLFSLSKFFVNYISYADFKFLVSNIIFMSSKFKNSYSEFGSYFFNLSNEIFRVSDKFSKHFKLNVIAPSFQYNRNIFDEWAVLYRKGNIGTFENLNETNVNTFFYALKTYLNQIGLREQVDFLGVGDFIGNFFASLYGKSR